MLARGLKTSVEGHAINVVTPLIHLSKAKIVTLAVKLKVPLELTWSCYNGKTKPCGVCDSCRLRAQGFAQAKIKDSAW
jgi:7-cyano-7-deazaguanine synthase